MKNQTTEVLSHPVRLNDAWSAMRKLLNDPDDTHQVFEIIEALSGNTGLRLLERIKRSAEGRELMERVDASNRALLNQPSSLIRRLADHESLMQLPEESLGRAYLRFLAQEKITADGLVEASRLEREIPPGALGAELNWLHDRLRDTHDLWHTVTGYHGDLIGEGALLAFSFAQTRNPGIGFIVGTILTVGPMVGGERLRLPSGQLSPRARTLIAHGFLRGIKARFLPAVIWEDLLDKPLDEVRVLLGVGEAPEYQPLRSHEERAKLGHPLRSWLQRLSEPLNQRAA